MIAVYLCRLLFFGMPPAMANNSIWVILGPIGQGANAILRLGRNAQVCGVWLKYSVAHFAGTRPRDPTNV